MDGPDFLMAQQLMILILILILIYFMMILISDYLCCMIHETNLILIS